MNLQKAKKIIHQRVKKEIYGNFHSIAVVAMWHLKWTVRAPTLRFEFCLLDENGKTFYSPTLQHYTDKCSIDILYKDIEHGEEKEEE